MVFDDVDDPLGPVNEEDPDDHHQVAVDFFNVVARRDPSNAELVSLARFSAASSNIIDRANEVAHNEIERSARFQTIAARAQERSARDSSRTRVLERRCREMEDETADLKLQLALLKEFEHRCKVAEAKVQSGETDEALSRQVRVLTRKLANRDREVQGLRRQVAEVTMNQEDVQRLSDELLRRNDECRRWRQHTEAMAAQFPCSATYNPRRSQQEGTGGRGDASQPGSSRGTNLLAGIPAYAARNLVNEISSSDSEDDITVLAMVKPRAVVPRPSLDSGNQECCGSCRGQKRSSTDSDQGSSPEKRMNDDDGKKGGKKKGKKDRK